VYPATFRKSITLAADYSVDVALNQAGLLIAIGDDMKMIRINIGQYQKAAGGPGFVQR